MHDGLITLARRVEFDRATDRPQNMTAPERPNESFVTGLVRLDFARELRGQFAFSFFGIFEGFERLDEFFRQLGFFLRREREFEFAFDERFTSRRRGRVGIVWDVRR